MELLSQERWHLVHDQYSNRHHLSSTGCPTPISTMRVTPLDVDVLFMADHTLCLSLSITHTHIHMVLIYK